VAPLALRADSGFLEKGSSRSSGAPLPSNWPERRPDRRACKTNSETSLPPAINYLSRFSGDQLTTIQLPTGYCASCALFTAVCPRSSVSALRLPRYQLSANGPSLLASVVPCLSLPVLCPLVPRSNAQCPLPPCPRLHFPLLTSAPAAPRAPPPPPFASILTRLLSPHKTPAVSRALHLVREASSLSSALDGFVSEKPVDRSAAGQSQRECLHRRLVRGASFIRATRVPASSRPANSHTPNVSTSPTRGKRPSR